MANRIENYEFLPLELPELFDGTLASERVQGLPEKFSDPEVERRNMLIHNRLLMNLNAVKEDLLLLKLGSLLSLEDYKGLVVFTDSELLTLKSLLASSPTVIARLGSLEQRVTNLETP